MEFSDERTVVGERLQLPSVELTKFKTGDDWQCFLSEFLGMATLANMGSSHQLAYLKQIIPEEGKKLLYQHRVDNVTQAVQLLTELYVPSQNCRTALQELWNIKQEPGERLRQVAGRIQEAVKNFGETVQLMPESLQEMSKEYFLFALTDEELKSHLLWEQTQLSFEDMVQRAQWYLDHRNTAKELCEKTQVAESDPERLKLQQLVEELKNHMEELRMHRDVRKTHEKKLTCICWNCGKKGHMARTCCLDKIQDGYTFRPKPRAQRLIKSRTAKTVQVGVQTTASQETDITVEQEVSEGMEFLPRPYSRPTGKVIQLWVSVKGYPSRVLALHDGGAEVAMMSYHLYQQLSPQPELRPTSDTVKGIYGPQHNPRGECTVQIEMKDLAVIIEYDVVVDDIEEDLLIDAAMMSHAGIQLKYDTQELLRKGRVAKGVSEGNRLTHKTRRVTLQKDWVIQPRSRQLVPGRTTGVDRQVPYNWMVEPSKLLGQQETVLVAKTLCEHRQVMDVIPVEVYNPTDETVQLFKNTTLGILSPLREVTDVQLETAQRTPVTVDRVVQEKPKKTSLPEELQQLVKEAEQTLNTSQTREFQNLIGEYRDIFSTKDEPLGKTDVVKHEIQTVGSPIKVPYRRIPAGLRDEAIQEEERMKKLGVIEPSESPWAAPVVLVRKKDGTLRYCIDYRRLNQVTVKDSYPLPNMQDCLDSLDGARYFSSIDLCSGYWQVQLSEDAKNKTSFYGAGGGFWRFSVMPFGLCNAPATFERLMERVLNQLQWQICLCYLDDILIFGQTVAQHLERLRKVFQRLREAKLKLKPKKCHFFQKEVTFLGHIVNAEGVGTESSKVQKITESPAPQNLTEVRSVLGLFSYYRRFIPHFSDIAKPLIKLTEKNKQFHWGEEQDVAFERLKELLSQAPILVHPRREGQFVLDTDASDVGIGAVLSQIQDGEEKVIAYASKTLSKSERNYCITRRELLAVVYFVSEFKHFLLGRKFLVRTDNSAVRYWMKIHSDGYDPQGQTARWMVKLAAYDFDIKHRAGKQHGNADSMSRLPFLQCAQCELRHRGASERKRVKTEPVTGQVQSQRTTERPVAGQVQSQRTTERPQVQTQKLDKTQSGGSLETDTGYSPTHFCVGGKVNKRNNDRKVRRDDSSDAKGCSDGQSGKARVLTRGRMPHGPKVDQGTAPSWMEGGVCLDLSVLRDEQLKDPACVDALCWLQKGKKPDKEEILSLGLDLKYLWGNFDCLVIRNGLLYKCIGPLVDGTSRATVYVPPALRRKVLKQCHDTKTSGHFYYWKTLNKVKKYFNWGGLSKDVQIYCQACQVCATRKTAGYNRKAKMRRYDVGFPMEEVAIDLMGPFPEAESGNKYVLVIVDSFSKWMEAYPVPNIEAKTVAEKLVLEFVSRFGVPYQIKSDRGKQFDCELFEQMCVMLEVEHRMSTPFHPQGNSRVERMVKVVGNLISTFCQSYRQWDRNLPLLTLAYRSTVHEVTGFTPNYVMMGREVALPLDIMLGTLDPNDRTTAPEYVSHLQNRLRGCFEEVRNHLKQTGEKQKRYYDLRAHGNDYKPGDTVYLREKTRKKQISPKLAPKWKGPYLIIKRFGTVYEVMISFNVTKLYHFDLLKPCSSTEIPPWIKRAKRRFVTDII